MVYGGLLVSSQRGSIALAMLAEPRFDAPADTG
jgi:hypothetical protein